MIGVGVMGKLTGMDGAGQPKAQGNAASRFVKATLSKLSHAPPVPPLASASTASRASKPAAKKEPGWKKFDLQASLARPLGYVPRKGPSPCAPSP